MRTRRRMLGLTQEGLSEVSGLSTNYIAKIELGWKMPSLGTLVKLAKGLNVELPDLLADENLKWMDKAQEVAFALRSLPDDEAEFLIKQFYTDLEHTKKLMRDKSNGD